MVNIMRTIEIPRVGRTPSRIYIGAELAARFADHVPSGARVWVVTDHNLARHYATLLAPYRVITIDTGEEHKTLQTVERICSELTAAGADRTSYLVGFGGGIVTDITGFVTDGDIDTFADQFISRNGSIHVRTRNQHAHALQHQTKGAHRYAADANQMHMLARSQIFFNLLINLSHVYQISR